MSDTPKRVIRMKHFADGHTEEIIDEAAALPTEPPEADCARCNPERRGASEILCAACRKEIAAFNAQVGAALPAEHAPPSRLRNVVAGFEIFQRNGSKSVNAEHDVIYAGPSTKDALNETDRDALRVAGWFWDEEVQSWGIYV